jgi:CBS domain-containing protein
MLRIADLMTGDVATCGEDTPLSAVGAIFREAGCGVLPVVDAGRRVIGMLTDRDVCVALAGKDARPSEATAADAMSRDVHAVRPQDDVERALKVMGAFHVHRVPVCDDEDRLLGILSMDDILVATSGPGGNAEAALTTLRLISEHLREKRKGAPLEPRAP